jgi:S-adenosylmethionine synthetase
VLTAIERQSPDIAQGVNEGDGLHKEQGAGDQGLMFGYATDETPEFMPAAIQYAHMLARQLAAVRKKKTVDFLRPDGKTQVTLEYDNDVPVRIDAVVVSTQHDDKVKYKQLREAIIELVIEKALPKKLVDKNTKLHVNPTGRFVIGGPQGDCGLTGRKIIVDTYGGMGRHGGGAFSGKDPSKVDRSACYYARYVAKNVVASGLAKRCEVQVAYAIGVARPVGVHVNTFGTGKVADEVLEKYILTNFDMRPKALIEELGLLAPIYKKTAAYGHFGRAEFSWEKTHRAAQMADDLLVSSPKATRPVASSTHGDANGRAPKNGEKAPKNGEKKVLRKRALSAEV